MNFQSVGRDFSSVQGPTDPFLRRSEIEGYQPVSRIGETVINSFVDAYEFAGIADTLTAADMLDDPAAGPGVVEHKPMFHEWSTALPGMIALGRKNKTQVFRQYQAAETAVPTIVCAACMPKNEEDNLYFAGIVRSKSVRAPDDGVGPSVDEFFTLSLGGMATLLNNSGRPVHAGDLIEWTLCGEAAANAGNPSKRLKSGPRRVAIKTASVSSDKIIGRALSFARNGEPFDLLIKQ